MSSGNGTGQHERVSIPSNCFFPDNFSLMGMYKQPSSVTYKTPHIYFPLQNPPTSGGGREMLHNIRNRIATPMTSKNSRAYLFSKGDNMLNVIADDPSVPSANNCPLTFTWRTFIQLDNEEDKASYASSCIKQEKELSSLGDVFQWHHTYGYAGEWIDLDRPSSNIIAPRDVSNGQGIQGVCLFKEGIHPTWEAPENAKGGHYEARYTISDINKRDTLNHVCFLLILLITGNEIDIDENKCINGIRILKKLGHRRKNDAKNFHAPASIKIEIWLRENDTKVLTKIDQEIARLWQEYNIIAPDQFSFQNSMQYKPHQSYSRGNSRNLKGY